MNKAELQGLATKHDGDGYITVNGQVEPSIIIAKMEVKVEAITSTKRFLNQRVEQNATRGLKINGSVAYYVTNDKLAKAIEEYKNGGSYPGLTFRGFATVGDARLEVLLTGVHLNSINLLSLDDSSDDESVTETDFTANDYQTL